MIVRLLGGPLAGRELSTMLVGPWAGDRLTAGDAGWGLYVPVHRASVTGVVLAEIRATAPRRRWRPGTLHDAAPTAPDPGILP